MSKRTNLQRVLEAINEGINYAWQFGHDRTKVNHSMTWARCTNGSAVSAKSLTLQSIQNVAFREASNVFHGPYRVNVVSPGLTLPHPAAMLRATMVAFEAVEKLGLIGSLAIETEARDEAAPEWNVERLRYQSGETRAPRAGFCAVITAATVERVSA